MNNDLYIYDSCCCTDGIWFYAITAVACMYVYMQQSVFKNLLLTTYIFENGGHILKSHTCSE